MRIILLGMAVLFSSRIFAAPLNTRAAMMPAAIGAKTLLEEMLAKRYAQELATFTDQELFTVSSKLEVSPVAPKSSPVAQTQEQEPVSDLALGRLDPEELLKKVAGSGQEKIIQSFLDQFVVRSVAINVGLREELPPEVKSSVEKWLADRVKQEFGNAGRSSVTIIKSKPAKKEEPKTLLDWLNQFQSLAGQIVTALAVLLAVILWKLLSTSSSTSSNRSVDSRVTHSGELKGFGESPKSAGTTVAQDGVKLAETRDKIQDLNLKINELLPRLQGQFESIVRSWCSQGENGRVRLACFAEAVGKELGKLPIPPEALDDVTKVFLRMPSLDLPEKLEALGKAYWDLLAVLNLGKEALNQPFGYLGGSNVAVVNQVLIGQNPKLKTLVSLYMPDDLRTKFLKSLTLEAKKELLQTAAGLSEIPAGELREMDTTLLGRMRPNQAQNVVPVDMTLGKIVSSLDALESMTLLPQIQGQVMNQFKTRNVNLAFIHEWPDSSLSLLVSRATADELSAYIRLRPALKDRIIKLCPPMTAEMVNEEINKEDKTSDKDKSAWLNSLLERAQQLVRDNEVDLEAIFASQGSGEKSNVINMAS